MSMPYGLDKDKIEFYMINDDNAPQRISNMEAISIMREDRYVWCRGTLEPEGKPVWFRATINLTPEYQEFSRLLERSRNGK